MDRNDSSLHVLAPVDRIINLLDVRGKLSSQLTHSSGSRGGDDNLEVGQARFQRANELGADIHFADAHGMDPKHVPVGDCLFYLGTEAAKALLQSIPPTAAPKHL